MSVEERLPDNSEQLTLLLTKSNVQIENIRIDKLNKEEVDSWLARLKKHVDSCGCETGSVFLSMAVCSILLYGIYRYFYIKTAIQFQEIIAAMFYCLAIAIIGKLVGLKAAKIKLRKEIELLTQLLKSR